MSTFVGGYVEDIKLALTASAVSGVHCLLIGAPGRGKTTIAKKMAEKMFPNIGVFLRFDATTPPEKIQGYPDIAKLLSENPVYELVTTGTAYDKNARVLIADELGRAMDTSFDIMLDVLDRQDINADDAAVVWGTSNFMPTSERTEAMRDRFGMWVHLPDERLDAKAIVLAQLDALGVGLDITDHIPTFSDIQIVRAARPGHNSKQAVADVLSQLADEASKGVTDDDGNTVAVFDVNPRRLDQWGRILYRMSVWLTKDPDFSIVPDQAKKCLQWCWPLADAQQAKLWASLCTAISDPIDAAIQNLLQATYKEFEKVSQENNSRQIAAQKLGAVMADGMRNLNMLGDDARISEAIGELTRVMGQYVRGENPFA